MHVVIKYDPGISAVNAVGVTVTDRRRERHLCIYKAVSYSFLHYTILRLHKQKTVACFELLKAEV